jgi:hypothetical protein
MASPDTSDSLAPRIRVMQIIGSALVMGLLIFMGVSLFLRTTGKFRNPPPDVPIISYVAAGFCGIQLIAFFFVPGIMVKAGRRRIGANVGPLGAGLVSAHSTGSLCGLYQTSMIVGDALLEGAALFLIIAFLIEGELIALLLAVFLLIILILQIPTRSRVERWIERQQELLTQEQV